MRETREVEKSISRIAIFPSFVSKYFENGSVVKIRYPREVPAGLVESLEKSDVDIPTAKWL